MLTKFATSAAALSLMLSAHVSTPAWPASLFTSDEKCTAKKHKHAKRVVVVERRKSSEVQILSYGP